MWIFSVISILIEGGHKLVYLTVDYYTTILGQLVNYFFI
jgi:hypothetical protein